MRTRKTMKAWLVGLLILYTGYGLVRWAFEAVQDREVNKEAEQWRERAQHDTTPMTTIAEAKCWLRRNGFLDLREGVGTRSLPGVDESYRLVTGSRQLREGRSLTKPAWLDLDFLFYPDEKFRQIDVGVRQYRVP
jgi:hypothetical protein